jgi:succinate-semialdehyde dehydrogenase/glutarate-semialdehyde dehydrogenase
VLSDADIEFAANNAIKGRMINTGQSCIAAKRFIVHESVIDEFTEKVVSKINALKVGDPLDVTTQYGPLARPDLASELATQVEGSVTLGAKILTGGKVFGESKAWFQPTVMSYVTTNMPVWNEETFGPVMPIMGFTTEDEALAMANSSRLGLGGSIWSTDTERAEQLAAQIQSGSVFVNGITKSDPRLPFGGIKMSGYGRELGTFGMKEFVNVQTVWVR